jgi:hypothetical protein
MAGQAGDLGQQGQIDAEAAAAFVTGRAGAFQDGDRGPTPGQADGGREPDQ